MKSVCYLSLSCVALFTGAFCQFAGAVVPSVTKCYATYPPGQWSNGFGNAVVSNDRWIVIGESAHINEATADGAVHVFSAPTGRKVRRFAETVGVTNAFFGTSLAIDGDTILIGHHHGAKLMNLRTGKFVRDLLVDFSTDFTYGGAVALAGRYALVADDQGDGLNPQSGVVHVFEVSTGEHLFDLVALDGMTFDAFGWSVAVDGQTAVVGARYANGSGTAYCFDLRTGLQIAELTPSDGAIGDGFGEVVAIAKHHAIVSAPAHSSDSGAVYVYDLSSGAQTKLVPSDLAPNDGFGRSLSVSGDCVLVGASGSSSIAPYAGAAFLFDLKSGIQLQKFLAIDGQTGDEFGTAVSLHGSTAVIAAPRDADLGIKGGSAYIFRQIAGPFPLQKVAGRGEFASAVPNASYRSFNGAAINADGEIMFTGVLTGSGAPRSENAGIWGTLSAGPQLDLVAQKSVKNPSFGVPMANQSNAALFEAGLADSAGDKAHSRGIFSYNGSIFSMVLRLGDPIADFGTAKAVKFLQVTQSAIFRQGVTVKLVNGVDGVTSANDTGLLLLNNVGGSMGAVREGGAADMGGTFGEFRRLATPGVFACFSAGLTGVVGKTQGIYLYSGGATNSLVARQGEAAPGAGGALFRTFTGETCSALSFPTFAATLSGPGVTSSNNLGLWNKATAGGALSLVARAGDPVPDVLPGVPTPLANALWRRVVQYWGINTPTGDQVLFLADMKGKGITAANDRALWLRQEDGTFRLLLQEGDALGDGSSARIGTFQRVMAESGSGQYAILIGLSNASSTNNQALLTGNTRISAKIALRCPSLRLRKGGLHRDPAGNPRTLRGISVSAAGFDATGAGGKGLSQVINGSGKMLMTVQFSDGAVELMEGTP